MRCCCSCFLCRQDCTRHRFQTFEFCFAHGLSKVVLRASCCSSKALLYIAACPRSALLVGLASLRLPSAKAMVPDLLFKDLVRLLSQRHSKPFTSVVLPSHRDALVRSTCSRLSYRATKRLSSVNYPLASIRSSL